MTRGNGSGGVSRLVWTILSGIGAILFALAMFLLNGSASRTQLIQSKLGDHGERITKVESRVDALESRVADLSARIAATEQKVDRMKNPPPWARSK